MLGSQIATNKFGNYTGNTYQGNFNLPWKDWATGRPPLLMINGPTKSKTIAISQV